MAELTKAHGAGDRQTCREATTAAFCCGVTFAKMVQRDTCAWIIAGVMETITGSHKSEIQGTMLMFRQTSLW